MHDKMFMYHVVKFFLRIFLCRSLLNNTMAEWTFLTKHALILSLIAKDSHVTAQELATSVGITERAVRNILRDLYKSRYINKERVGRGIHYQVNRELPLRHHTHGEVVIGDLLRTLGWEESKVK